MTMLPRIRYSEDDVEDLDNEPTIVSAPDWHGVGYVEGREDAREGKSPDLANCPTHDLRALKLYDRGYHEGYAGACAA